MLTGRIQPPAQRLDICCLQPEPQEQERVVPFQERTRARTHVRMRLRALVGSNRRHLATPLCVVYTSCNITTHVDISP